MTLHQTISQPVGDGPRPGVNGARPVGDVLAPIAGVVGPPASHPGPANADAPTDHRVQRSARRVEIADRKWLARRTRKSAARADRLALRKTRRADRREVWSTRWLAGRLLAIRLRPVAPLLVVNASAVYGQVAYAFDHISPTDWTPATRLALAIMFALAVESIALYVGWHAHDALLAKAYTRARHLRLGSYAVAAVVGAMNYAHFAGPAMAPTAAAVGFGLLSLVSPGLWGMHTRRQQHIQLVAESAVDRAGVEFDPRRRRQFPIMSWQANRWAILHNVTDPVEAWNRYRDERTEARATKAAEARRREVAKHARRIAETAAKKGQQGETLRALREYAHTLSAADRLVPTGTPTTPSLVGTYHLPPIPTGVATRSAPTTRKVGGGRRAKRSAPTTTNRRFPPVAIRDAAFLRTAYGSVGADRLPGRNELVREHGWNGGKATDARAAFLAGADLTEGANQ